MTDEKDSKTVTIKPKSSNPDASVTTIEKIETLGDLLEITVPIKGGLSDSYESPFEEDELFEIRCKILELIKKL